MENEAAAISLTDKAAEMVLKIRAEQAIPDGQALRLQIVGGGCAGFSYDLYFDEFKPDMDQKFMIKGVEVIVDNMSLMYLAGTELDWVDGLMGAGFRLNNPNAKSTCGCGSSFEA